MSDIFKSADNIISKIDELRRAAALMGKKGGSVKSERKTKAVRENGKLGGRPKGKGKGKE